MSAGVEWQDRASCRSVPPDLFFQPENGAGARNWTPEKAKLVCAECPVFAPCLREALSSNSVLIGIWAHTTEFERRQLLQWKDAVLSMSDEAIRKYLLPQTKWVRTAKHGNRLRPPLQPVRINDDRQQHRGATQSPGEGVRELRVHPGEGERLAQHAAGGGDPGDAFDHEPGIA